MAAGRGLHSAPAAVGQGRELPAASEPSDVQGTPTGDGSRRVAAVVAGIVLVVAGVAGMHFLFRGGDGAVDWVVWIAGLLVWVSALGGGIKLATWAAKPVIDDTFGAVKQRLSEEAQAVCAALGVIVGAVGLWWVLRGGYTQWWQQLSGEHRWSLILGAGQMLVAVLAGAVLFTGGQYLIALAGQVLAHAGLTGVRGTENRATARKPAHNADAANDAHDVHDAGSHPMLLAALIAGGVAVVVMTVWLAPAVAPAIAGANTLAAAVSIAGMLVWGVWANLGWWKGLEGLYTWATAASAAAQKAGVVAGVVAVVMFSASGLGLGWFSPATVPQARADCPPDCGGGANGSNSYGPDASQFKPPQMQNQMPDYQGGNNNRAPMDQSGSVSIYNTQAPSISQNGTGGHSVQQQGAQPGWDKPVHGTQIPDYQDATPFTQGPGRPNPDYHPNKPGTNPGSQGTQTNQGSNQGAQQPQQQPSQPGQQQQQQLPQDSTSQQPPNQSDQQRLDDLARQLRDQQQQGSQDRQRLDDLTRQLRQQDQKQQLPRFPSRDKEQDDRKDRDKQSGDNDTSALLLGAASTRRRKQDDQQQPEQDQQQQGPDTQALAQDGAQLGQSLPADIANTVSDSVNLAQSAGSAAQNFASAAQAGASIAASAQSGAVNPMDAVAVVQGISGGISDTADAVASGASIASTWINNAGQALELVGDVDPQLKPQIQQIQQLTQAGGQLADLTGQIAGGVSQASGVVNTASGLGSGGIPAGGGTAEAMSGPTDGGDKLPYELQNGPVPGDDADEIGSLNSIQDLLDQAIVDKQQQVVPLQQALDKVAAQAYMGGPGSGFASAKASAEQLRGQVAQLYGDIGALSQSADAVSTLQGGVLDGTGTVLDPNNLFQYTFRNGVLTSANYRDPGQVEAVMEPLFSAVTAITGIPAALRGISALLAREGVAEVATVTAENVLTRAGTQATAQASAAAARLAANRAAGNAFRDAFAQSLGGAANGIKTEVYYGTSKGARYIDVFNPLRGGAAFETKTGRISLDSEITKQIAKDAELLGNDKIKSVAWVFKLVDPTKAASPANGGPTANLLKKLTEAGFSVLYR